MKKFLITLSLLAAGSIVAFAGPIEDRQAIMKERAGILKNLAPFAKGEQDYDAAAVEKLLTALDANAKHSAKDLFPEGTESKSASEDNAASPKIWEDWAGFQAAWDKHAATTTAAVAAKPQDAAALQAQFEAIGMNCGGCHQAYRLKKD